MAKLKDLKVTIGLSKKGLTKLNSDLRSTKANFRRNFGEIQAMAQNMGRSLSIGVTAPLGLMAVQSVKAFDTQAKAIAQVEAGLKSTAGQVGYTSEQLQRMASDLQTKTLFGDEVILKDATAQLLTFTNIAGDNFARTQAVALDLATRLDGDLKSASIQLGKALNDPIANLSALSRSGIQFSADQKEVIKSLTESGRLAEAQTIILEELEKQYGGSAEAAAEAGTGPFKQLQNTLGDLSEEFGKLINDMLKPLVPRIQALVQGFSSLSDRQKEVALTVAAIAAAAGPIMMVVSALMKARTAMLALNVVMAANPIGAVVAGTALLVTAMATLKASIKTTREETEGFIVRTKELDKEQQILALNTKRRALETELAQLQQAKAAEEAAAQVGALGDKFDKQIATGNVSRFAGQITDTEAAIIALKKATAEAQFGEGAQVGVSVLPTPTEEEVATTQQLGQALKVDVLPPMKEAELMRGKMATDILAAAQANHTLKGSIEAVQTAVIPTKDALVAMGEYAATQLPGFFENAFGVLMDGTQSFGEYMMSVLESLLKKLAAMLAAFAAMSVLFPGSGAVAGGLGKFVAGGFGIPAFAAGGLVSGATLAMVGEGAGTSLTNPEVIAPLDKLQQMMGGNQVQVTGVIRGQDLLLTNERAQIDRNRLRSF